MCAFSNCWNLKNIFISLHLRNLHGCKKACWDLTLVFVEHNWDISASLKHPEWQLQLSRGLCEALLVLHVTHKLLLMLFQGMLNATQTLHLVALMFNLSISKFEPTIHLLVHVDEFHLLLFLNEGIFLKNLIFINSSYWLWSWKEMPRTFAPDIQHSKIKNVKVVA